MTPRRAPVRVTVPDPAKAGQIVPVTVAIGHPMASGHQVDAQGQRESRNILTRFECHAPDGLIVALDLQPAIAANPSVQFHLRATQTLTLRMRWFGDHGFELEHHHVLRVE